MRNTTRFHLKMWLVMPLVLYVLGACSGSGSSAGQFDNARAGKIIMDRIKSEQVAFLKSSGKAIEYEQKEPATTPQQYQAFCKGSKDQKDRLAKLEEKNLVKAQNDQQNDCTFVSFLEKATPYVQKHEKGMIVLLAAVDKVEVTDLGTGSQIRTVKYKVSYTPTPFGEVLLKTENLSEEKEAGFSLSFDEGWRMN